MTDLPQLLHDRLQPAFAAIAPEVEAPDPVVRRSDHADYQANGALPLAKRLGRNPREIATEVLARAELDDLVAHTEIAGPGFINLTVADAALNRLAEHMAADDRAGVSRVGQTIRAVVDYPSPNATKEMHVGHLRPTMIGDFLVRTLEFLGHEVIRRNHLGDWGTPFGMLLEHLVDLGVTDAAAAGDLEIGDLDTFYQEARKKFDADTAFADRSRNRVVSLQSGDENTVGLWRIFVDESRRHFHQLYRRLGIRIRPEDDWGESAYNDSLASTVEELRDKGIAVQSEGALVAFPEGFTGREGKPAPLILRKRDGGFGYDVTDLAALRHRVRDLQAQRLVYLTDLGQRMHFEMVFRTAREAGWLGDGVEAEFDGFGVVLGPDRQRLRTRAGDNPKFSDLVNEAVRRAAHVVAEKAPYLDTDEQAAVAEMVGVGAMKYADLSSDRVKDYVFDYDQMLSFEGNTAPYLQYAHARIHSVFAKGEIDSDAAAQGSIAIAEPAEHVLVLRLGEFEPAIRAAAAAVEPHRIAAGLFDIATAFTAFYEKCPVLRAEGETRRSRLALCALTAKVLGTGLELLGIAAPRRM